MVRTERKDFIFYKLVGNIFFNFENIIIRFPEAVCDSLQERRDSRVGEAVYDEIDRLYDNYP